MKKYFILIALMLFGRAYAKTNYPILRTDTTTFVLLHHGSYAEVISTVTKTVIDSEMTLFYLGKPVTIPTWAHSVTMFLEKRNVEITSAIATKFSDRILEHYLKSGQQIAVDEKIVSLKYGFVENHYVLYVKNNRLYYRKQRAVFNVPLFIMMCIGIFSSCFIARLILLKDEKQLDQKNLQVGWILNIIAGLIMCIIFWSESTDDKIYIWDQGLAMILLTIPLFLLAQQVWCWVRRFFPQ